jgi:hypothetical protein
MMSPTARRGSLFVLIALAGPLVANGCDTGNEGYRCNPSLSHDECGSGLRCTQPPLCPENYCCPIDGPSDNPYCQPGCAGGQQSICASDGDADCAELGTAGGERGEEK